MWHCSKSKEGSRRHFVLLNIFLVSGYLCWVTFRWISVCAKSRANRTVYNDLAVFYVKFDMWAVAILHFAYYFRFWIFSVWDDAVSLCSKFYQNRSRLFCISYCYFWKFEMAAAAISETHFYFRFQFSCVQGVIYTILKDFMRFRL